MYHCGIKVILAEMKKKKDIGIDCSLSCTKAECGIDSRKGNRNFPVLHKKIFATQIFPFVNIFISEGETAVSISSPNWSLQKCYKNSLY